MKLWAISDTHVGHKKNRDALEGLPSHPDDWLILGGDVCESVAELDAVLAMATARYAHVVWVPGNHELWSVPADGGLRGEAKYDALVDCCRNRGVQTPEDPYRIFEGEGGPRLIAPLFILYDYSFCPDGLTPAQAIDWARQSGIMCVDEIKLSPWPHASVQDWCGVRVKQSKARLEHALRDHDCPLVLVNHFPLRSELAWLPRIPRFSIWCGTRKTEDWHVRFRAELVVFGHLHMRQRRIIDGVRFEEVSLGYPRQWRSDAPVSRYLRRLLPAETAAPVRY